MKLIRITIAVALAISNPSTQASAQESLLGFQAPANAVDQQGRPLSQKARATLTGVKGDEDIAFDDRLGLNLIAGTSLQGTINFTLDQLADRRRIMPIQIRGLGEDEEVGLVALGYSSRSDGLEGVATTERVRATEALFDARRRVFHFVKTMNDRARAHLVSALALPRYTALSADDLLVVSGMESEEIAGIIARGSVLYRVDHTKDDAKVTVVVTRRTISAFQIESFGRIVTTDFAAALKSAFDEIALGAVPFSGVYEIADRKTGAMGWVGYAFQAEDAAKPDRLRQSADDALLAAIKLESVECDLSGETVFNGVISNVNASYERWGIMSSMMLSNIRLRLREWTPPQRHIITAEDARIPPSGILRQTKRGTNEDGPWSMVVSMYYRAATPQAIRRLPELRTSSFDRAIKSAGEAQPAAPTSSFARVIDDAVDDLIGRYPKLRTERLTVMRSVLPSEFHAFARGYWARFRALEKQSLSPLEFQGRVDISGRIFIGMDLARRALLTSARRYENSKSGELGRRLNERLRVALGRVNRAGVTAPEVPPHDRSIFALQADDPDDAAWTSLRLTGARFAVFIIVEPKEDDYVLRVEVHDLQAEKRLETADFLMPRARVDRELK